MNNQEKLNTIIKIKSGTKSFKELLQEYRGSTSVTEKHRIQQEIIQKGRELKKERYALGWRQTPDGFLSPKDIEEAGFILMEGEYRIPGQEYIADRDSPTHKIGEKYWYFSKKYINWKKRRDFRRYGHHYDNKVEDLIKNETNEIIVEAINF